jgi:pterin-4a-carbinolamine dehydratase
MLSYPPHGHAVAAAAAAAAAVKFFNQVAELAEEEGHHPDLHLTNYREVQVGSCSTL